MIDPVTVLFVSADLSVSETWQPTLQLRWFRPQGGTDTDMVLQQAWASLFGKIEWRELPTVLAD